MTPQSQQFLAGLAAAGAAVVDDASGRRCLNVEAVFPFTAELAAGALRLDLSQTVGADADFYWRGWRWVPDGLGAGDSLVRARLSTSGGYYFANSVAPLGLVGAYSITKEVLIPAGGFIRIEAENQDVIARRLRIIFTGVQRFWME